MQSLLTRADPCLSCRWMFLKHEGIAGLVGDGGWRVASVRDHPAFFKCMTAFFEQRPMTHWRRCDNKELNAAFCAIIEGSKGADLAASCTFRVDDVDDAILFRAYQRIALEAASHDAAGVCPAFGSLCLEDEDMKDA